MKRLSYVKPTMLRFEPVRDVTLLTRCSPFEQNIYPKRGHAVFAG